MYTALGEQRLKSGETLAMGVVECPDAGWAERVAPFLGHKNRDTRAHIRRALEGPLDELETRFYVGCIDDEIATEVMIVGSRGVGILGHVYTHPNHRRKGAYTQLMRAQMDDMARVGVSLLCLSTTFDSAPYWIYHEFGFRSIAEGLGQMIWEAAPGSADALLRAGQARVRPLRWDDWSWLDFLGMQPVAADEVLPRAAVLRLKGRGSLEGPFVPLQLEREGNPAIQAFALESERGATVGFALAAPDRNWFRDAWTADVYVHPNFRGQEAALLEAVAWPDAPCVTYRVAGGSSDEPGAAAWRAAGFAPETVLPGWVAVDGERRNLELWVRYGRPRR